MMRNISKLKKSRFEKNITQWELSRRSHVPQSKISLIESGYIIPSDLEKKQLSRALKCRVEDIFPDSLGIQNV